jgi:uncharacterized protein YjiS (DUF1127 family)
MESDFGQQQRLGSTTSNPSDLKVRSSHMSATRLYSPLPTLREWRRRVRDRRQLGSLSDSMLEDIGISRAEAEYLSNKPFWRE